MKNKAIMSQSRAEISSRVEGDFIIDRDSELIIHESVTGRIENYGKLTVHGSIQGTIINQSNAKLTVNGKISGDKLTNQTDAKMTIGIKGKVTHQTFDNFGMIILDGVIDSKSCTNKGSGTIKNKGNLKSATNLGTIINSGSLGSIDNQGTIS